jgi:hypothetical protein
MPQQEVGIIISHREQQGRKTGNPLHREPLKLPDGHKRSEELSKLRNQCTTQKNGSKNNTRKSKRFCWFKSLRSLIFFTQKTGIKNNTSPSKFPHEDPTQFCSHPTKNTPNEDLTQICTCQVPHTKHTRRRPYTNLHLPASSQKTLQTKTLHEFAPAKFPTQDTPDEDPTQICTCQFRLRKQPKRGPYTNWHLPVPPQKKNQTKTLLKFALARFPTQNTPGEDPTQICTRQFRPRKHHKRRSYTILFVFCNSHMSRILYSFSFSGLLTFGGLFVFVLSILFLPEMDQYLKKQWSCYENDSRAFEA